MRSVTCGRRDRDHGAVCPRGPQASGRDRGAGAHPVARGGIAASVEIRHSAGRRAVIVHSMKAVARRPVGRPAAATKEELLAEARRRFLRGERVELQDVAQRLGLARMTVYRWFGSRDGLMGEVLAQLGEGLVDAAAAHTREAGSPRAARAVRARQPRHRVLRGAARLPAPRGTRRTAGADRLRRRRAPSDGREHRTRDPGRARRRPSGRRDRSGHARLRDRPPRGIVLVQRCDERHPRRRGPPARRSGGPARHLIRRAAVSRIALV